GCHGGDERNRGNDDGPYEGAPERRRQPLHRREIASELLDQRVVILPIDGGAHWGSRSILSRNARNARWRLTLIDPSLWPVMADVSFRLRSLSTTCCTASRCRCGSVLTACRTCFAVSVRSCGAAGSASRSGYCSYCSGAWTSRELSRTTRRIRSMARRS